MNLNNNCAQHHFHFDIPCWFWLKQKSLIIETYRDVASFRHFNPESSNVVHAPWHVTECSRSHATNVVISAAENTPLVTMHTVFAEISAHPEINTHQKQWFSKGGVHKTDGFWWVIFQRGEYIKPMASEGWFFKGGSTQNRWLLMGFGISFIASKN